MEMAETDGEHVSSVNRSKRTADHGIHRWIVVLACFMSNLIVGGIDRSEGIFYLKFIDKFNGSAQATSWAVSLAGALKFVLGPMSTVVSNKFGSRLTVVMGGIFLFASFLVTGYASSLVYLYFSFGLLGGIGRSFVYTQSLMVVCQYFAGKPGLAVGIATAGFGVGSFAIPPLITFMFGEFNFWGVFLILSAIMLNICASGAMLRPVHRRRRRTHAETGNVKTRKTCNVLRDKNPVQLTYVNRGFTSEENDIKRYRDRLEKKDDDLASSATNHDWVNVTTTANNENDNKTILMENTQEKTRLLDLSLLKNSSFTMFCMSVLLFSGAFKAAFTFFPALAESRGCTETEVALIMSVMGILGTFGGIVSGFLFDLEKVLKYRTFSYSVVLILISATSFACPFMFGFAQFACISGVYGTLTGTYLAHMSIVLVDILGVTKLQNAYGLLLLSQGLGSLLGPPLSGLLKDIFDDYAEVFFLAGGLMAASAGMMVASNILLAAQRWKTVSAADK